jgi:hypothetical protein
MKANGNRAPARDLALLLAGRAVAQAVVLFDGYASNMRGGDELRDPDLFGEHFAACVSHSNMDPVWHPFEVDGETGPSRT